VDVEEEMQKRGFGTKEKLVRSGMAATLSLLQACDNKEVF
jgi:hypothetical protein